MTTIPANEVVQRSIGAKRDWPLEDLSLNQLKISASSGKTGNDGPPDPRSQLLYCHLF